MAYKSSKKRKSTSLITKLKGKIGWFYYIFIIIYYAFYFAYNAIYYLFYGIYLLFKGIIIAFVWLFNLFGDATDKTIKYTEKKRIEKKRRGFSVNYVPFKIIETDSGAFAKFEEKLSKSDSTIGLILGARGSGKTAIAVKLIENIYAKTKKSCYAFGFNEEDMPAWINIISDIKHLRNNSYVLIDEGGILFSSRRSMSDPNKLLSELILIARHKNISIIFISQNSANLEINAIRQADYLILKTSSLLQKDFERKKIKEIYEQIGRRFKTYSSLKGVSYIYSDEFSGFVENKLPSFWTKEISKSFRKEE